MKIKIVFLLIIIIISTGCGNNSLNCKKKYNDKIKYSVKINANSKNNKVISSKAKITFEKASDASDFCEINKMINNEKINVSCYEKEIIIDNYHYIEMGNNKEIKIKELKARFKQQGFKC